MVLRCQNSPKATRKMNHQKVLQFKDSKYQKRTKKSTPEHSSRTHWLVSQTRVMKFPSANKLSTSHGGHS